MKYLGYVQKGQLFIKQYTDNTLIPERMPMASDYYGPIEAENEQAAQTILRPILIP